MGSQLWVKALCVLLSSHVCALAWHIDAVATPATNLQNDFEVLPPSLGKVGWLGADSDVSVVIRGGSSGRRVLWIFADTFVMQYNETSNSRLLPLQAMPHSTLAISQCTLAACHGPPLFSIRKNASGAVAPAMFENPAVENGKETVWPVAAISSRNRGMVLVLAQRVDSDMNLLGFASISLEVGDGDDPSQWNYTMRNAGGPELTWFSGITYMHPDLVNDDTVYLFGHKGNSQDTTLLSRARLSALLQHRWDELEFWSQGGVWMNTSHRLLEMEVPSWEATWHWSVGLGLWYTFNLNNYEVGGAAINMWTAEYITGPWANTSLLLVPPPFNSTTGPDPKWTCYAAKAHPELVTAQFDSGAGKDELVFSYVCNAGQDVMNSELFQTGGMDMAIRGYWPRFVRVAATRRPYNLYIA
jgi:hypothetical protein